MSLLAKVTTAPFICKIALDFTGALTALKENQTQNFYNSEGNQYTWQNTHFGKQSVNFKETEKLTKAGAQYTQNLKFTIPVSDENRADRIALIKKAKFVRMELSNGNILVMGRNDVYQNKLPIIKINSTHKALNVTFTTISMATIGYLKINDVSAFIDFLMPEENPINLINI